MNMTMEKQNLQDRLENLSSVCLILDVPYENDAYDVVLKTMFPCGKNLCFRAKMTPEGNVNLYNFDEIATYISYYGVEVSDPEYRDIWMKYRNAVVAVPGLVRNNIENQYEFDIDVTLDSLKESIPKLAEIALNALEMYDLAN